MHEPRHQRLVGVCGVSLARQHISDRGHQRTVSPQRLQLRPELRVTASELQLLQRERDGRAAHELVPEARQGELQILDPCRRRIEECGIRQPQYACGERRVGTHHQRDPCGRGARVLEHLLHADGHVREGRQTDIAGRQFARQTAHESTQIPVLTGIHVLDLFSNCHSGHSAGS